MFFILILFEDGDNLKNNNHADYNCDLLKIY